MLNLRSGFRPRRRGLIHRIQNRRDHTVDGVRRGDPLRAATGRSVGRRPPPRGAPRRRRHRRTVRQPGNGRRNLPGVASIRRAPRRGVSVRVPGSQQKLQLPARVQRLRQAAGDAVSVGAHRFRDGGAAG